MDSEERCPNAISILNVIDIIIDTIIIPLMTLSEC